MAKKEVRCGKCMFRAKPLAQNTCDYFAITGHTRKAVLPEKCRHFRAGERIEPERCETSPNGAPARTQQSGPGGERRSKGANEVFAAGGNGTKRTLRRRGAKPKYDWAKARKLYEKGLNDGVIGRAIGCG